VSRGKVHKYLGMTLDYTTKGKVDVQEILNAFDKAEPEGAGTKNRAAPADLFKIHEDCDKLNDKRATDFHNIVAKTLYASKRARPNTCTAVAFLTTRVREPAQDDWAKMVHLMKYIRGTELPPLILSPTDNGILKCWWIGEHHSQYIRI
jgi:hypothetical protein